MKTESERENTAIPIDKERLVRPDIIFDQCRYKWSEYRGGYFGNDGSCGTYGAALNDWKWIPAWIPQDSCYEQWANESFDNPEAAIARSNSYFS